MPRHHEYRFRIDVLSVDTLPMARLAEYMGHLAALLGEPERVHFARVEEGSAVLVSNIEDQAVSMVARRLNRVREGKGPPDAMKAFKSLDTLLAKDDATGSLIGECDTEIISFPGRNRPKPVRYGPFREWGSLDGVLVRIGGKDRTVPVWLMDGEKTHICNTSVDVSMRLAPYYRKETLRVRGSGRWCREEDGSWTMDQFDIEDFEVLDDAPLSEVVDRLRAVEGGDWGSGEAALTKVLELRRDEREPH